MMTDSVLLKKDVLQNIQNNDLQVIRINYLDLTGVSRGRNVPIEIFVRNVMDDGIDYPSAMFYTDSSALIVENAVGPDDGFPSWILKPDLSTFTSLPWCPRVGKVIADIADSHGNPITYAPRAILKKALSELNDRGLYIKGGFEFEFYVFKKENDNLVPILDFSNVFSEMSQIKCSFIVDEIMDGLRKVGSYPEFGNTEYGPGQFEITCSPKEGITIADIAVFYKTAIKEILLKNGLFATFMSMPLANHSTSGGHLHLSMFDSKGENQFFDPNDPNGISETMKFFIAGQLKHALALNALCNSTINSYKRIMKHFFAPQNATWGFDNRTTMVRIPRFRGQHTRLENRIPGADTNPYLALAAIVLAGLDGIDSRTPLPLNTEGNAAFSDAPRLQTDLSLALKSLKEDKLFLTKLGSEFITQYERIRLFEYERYQKQITKWEIDEYLDLF